MRRRVVLAVVLLSMLPVVGACSGTGSPAPVGSSSAQPTDTSSPLVTGTTTPAQTASQTPVPGTPTDSTTASATLDLPACMIGSWAAPVAREFDHLGVVKRSEGAITAGTGTLGLTFAANRGFTFSYQQVRLTLDSGQAEVNGTLTGMWTLTGNTLTTAVTKSAVTTKVTMAGISVPNPYDDLVQSLSPNDVMVTCTGTGLQLLLPGAQGGGLVTFDKA